MGNHPRVIETCKQAVANNPEATCEEQCAAALKELRGWTGFKALVNQLVTAAIQGIIYDQRHAINRQIKESSGYYGKGPAVPTGSTGAVARVFRSYYNVFIGNRTLGSIKYSEIPALIETQEGLRNGHHRNVCLLRKVYENWPKGAGDTTVKGAYVTEMAIRKLAKEADKLADTTNHRKVKSKAI